MKSSLLKEVNEYLCRRGSKLEQMLNLGNNRSEIFDQVLQQLDIQANILKSENQDKPKLNYGAEEFTDEQIREEILKKRQETKLAKEFYREELPTIKAWGTLDWKR